MSRTDTPKINPADLTSYTAWAWFSLSRWWLATRGCLPWHLMTFLKDAHRRGILRQMGAIYQFRHARLQDRVAGRKTENTDSGTEFDRPG